MPTDISIMRTKKKVVLYTKATDGSGDFTAALKILPSLFKDPDIHVTWIVNSQQEKIKQAIKDLRESKTFSELELINIDNKAFEFEPALQDAILSHIPIETDLIIVLPNVGNMESLHWQFVRERPKTKIAYITEYDYPPTYFMNTILYYSMGLGEDSVGVLVPEPPAKPMASLTQIKGLEGFEAEKPFFFAYCNNEMHSQVSPNALVAYLDSIGQIAKNEGHDPIQLITNIPSEIIARSAFADKIKVFKPFPISPEAFQSLLHRSHPVALCTGDQSLIENLFASKSVFYQVMKWKKGLAEALKRFVKDICGEESLYYKFLSTAIDKPEQLPIMLQEEEWKRVDFNALKSDAHAIVAAIEQRKNFTKVFPLVVSLYLASPEQRLEILQQSKADMSSKMFATILRIFRNESREICQGMKEQLPNIIKSTDDFCILFGDLSKVRENNQMEAKAAEALDPLLFKAILEAIQKNMPNIVRNGNKLKEMLEFFDKLPTGPFINVWEAVEPAQFRSLLHSGKDLFWLLMLSEKLPPKQRLKIADALEGPPPLTLHYEYLYELRGVIEEFADILPKDRISNILKMAEPQLGPLIKTGVNLISVLRFSLEEFSIEQRTALLEVLEPKLGSLFKNESELKNVLQLPDTLLNSSQRAYILKAVQKDNKISLSDSMLGLFQSSTSSPGKESGQKTTQFALKIKNNLR